MLSSSAHAVAVADLLSESSEAQEDGEPDISDEVEADPEANEIGTPFYRSPPPPPPCSLLGWAFQVQCSA